MLKDKEAIKHWLNSMKIENYTINDDFTVDVDGYVDISQKKLINIPVQFGIVKDHFACNDNQLTNLDGCPQSVGKDFHCNNNQLTSLVGCPQSVGEGFYCYNNQLISLEGSPQVVGEDFFCYNNQLTTLKGCPQVVGGNFSCNDNILTNLDNCPKSVDGDFNCLNNPILDLNNFECTFSEDFYHNGYIIESFAEFYIEGELFLTYKEMENINLNNKLNETIKNKTETINPVNKKKL